MALKTTTWSPDTCDCVLEYTWDSAEPETTRTHRPSRYLWVCPAHADADIHRAFDKTRGDNVRKNRAVAVLLEHDPALDPRTITWRFDDARRLHLDAPFTNRGTARSTLAVALAQFNAQID